MISHASFASRPASPGHLRAAERGSCVGWLADFVRLHRRLVYTVVVLTLAVCLLCPYAEWSLHSNQSIFQTGRDTETSVGLLTLSVALALAAAELAGGASFIRWQCLTFLIREMPRLLPAFAPAATPLPSVSPPSTLRI